MRRLLLFIFVLVFVNFLTTRGVTLNFNIQDLLIDTVNINQLDSNGNKTGAWISGDISQSFSIDTYEDGKLNGPSFFLVKNKTTNKLRIYDIRYYSNDMLTGTLTAWMSDDEFFPSWVIYDIKMNEDFRFPLWDSTHIFTYQGYSRSFYPNGKIRSEGWMVFDDNDSSCYIVDCEDVGKQLRYNEDGSFEIFELHMDDIKKFNINRGE